jgi:folylpolyglutamate synthase/dihydropteroate synthase
MQLQQAGINKRHVSICGEVENACQMVQTEAVTGDRIIVFGSSYTVSALLQSGIIGGEAWKKRTNL